MKTYPGEAYVPRRRRATYESDDGRRGALWIHGAFEPATGEAALTFSARRDSASHIALLEHVVTAFPRDLPDGLDHRIGPLRKTYDADGARECYRSAPY